MSQNTTLKQLERSVANDTTPSLSSVDVLSSLKLFGTLKKQLVDSTSEAEKKIIGEELKYLDSAMEAVSRNHMLSSKFGGGFGAAMAVAELMKERQSERIYQHIIDKSLDEYVGLEGDLKPFETDNYVKKYNGGKGIVMYNK